jgi:hypothetical protein
MPGIPIEHIERVWPIAEAHFKNAAHTADGPFDIEELKQDCLKGVYILWIGRNSKVSVILGVSDYHNGKECDIRMLAGEEINTWISELKEIESFAKRAGCNRMTITGRKAWERTLKEYKLVTVNMVKAL